MRGVIPSVAAGHYQYHTAQTQSAQNAQRNAEPTRLLFLRIQRGLSPQDLGNEKSVSEVPGITMARRQQRSQKDPKTQQTGLQD